MKKVLLIAYFFPPANFAGSYRVASWAKYLHRFGYYPVIITRQWNKDQSNSLNRVVDNRTVVEIHEHYEVHYVAVEYSLRERIIHRYPALYSISKILVVMELLLKGIIWAFHPSAFLYRYAMTYLDSHHDIAYIIATGNPFELFRIGSALSRLYHIPWIADYRDGWTNLHVQRPGMLFWLQHAIDVWLERRWMKNVSFITTVNDDLVRSISAAVSRPTYKVMNGYDPQDYEGPYAPISVSLDPQALRLVYNGTLYNTQDITVFMDGIRLYLQQYPDSRLQVIFPGILQDASQQKRIADAAGPDLIPYILMTTRLPKKEVIALQKSADILIFFTHGQNLKGTIGSKIFEYYGIGRPILIVPNDHDEVELAIARTSTGYAADTAADVAAFIAKVKNKEYHYAPDSLETEQYTREKQTGMLAGLMDQYAGTQPKSNE